MNEFELGKEIAQLSSRISLLESRMLTTNIREEDIQFDETLIEDELAFDLVLDVGVKPGSCKASYVARWQNKKVEFTVCAKSGDEAKEKAAKAITGEIKSLIRDAAGLDCSSRSGCAAPATCQEKFSNLKAKLLGKWTCTDTGNQGECKAGETEYTCFGWFNISGKIECKCIK